MDIYVSEDGRSVYVQWDERGPLSVLREDNTVHTVYRCPKSTPDWSSDRENTADWQCGHDEGYSIGWDEGYDAGKADAAQALKPAKEVAS